MVKCIEYECEGDTEVINSRYNIECNVIGRRRQCKKCGARFNTKEAHSTGALRYTKTENIIRELKEKYKDNEKTLYYKVFKLNELEKKYESLLNNYDKIKKELYIHKSKNRITFEGSTNKGRRCSVLC